MGQAEATATGPTTDAVTHALRSAAARASEALGGSPALLFSTLPQDGPDGQPILRAAAGYATPTDARTAAAAIAGLVGDVSVSHEMGRQASEASGKGCLAVPLLAGGRCWGVLTAAGEDARPDAAAVLQGLADAAALRLDHAWLDAHRTEFLQERESSDGGEEPKGDEILKLSEALFAQDIELLRSNEKLGKVERLKNDFIEKMSRELRTPLNNIIESIISVLAGENENLSDLAKDNLRTALDEGTVFLRTLQNILDLWRIKQGELPLESQEVNFREVVEEGIFSVQDTIDGKPIVIEKNIKEPLPKIRTDLPKVNQILFLLLDNAAQFTNEGRIEIDVEVIEGTLRCQITDTGIGICNDDRDLVFDEFFQVDEAASTRYRGAGLGLTLVRELLALLEGEISIDSEIGRGTAVTFTVPVRVL